MWLENIYVRGWLKRWRLVKTGKRYLVINEKWGEVKVSNEVKNERKSGGMKEDYIHLSGFLCLRALVG